MAALCSSVKRSAIHIIEYVFLPIFFNRLHQIIVPYLLLLFNIIYYLSKILINIESKQGFGFFLFEQGEISTFRADFGKNQQVKTWFNTIYYVFFLH